MASGMVFRGLAEFEAALGRMAAAADAATSGAVAEGAALIEAKAKRNALASRVTGSNMRSIYTEGPTGAALGYSAKVGPSMIYSRRLELGFHGTDSLGRHYNQAAQPFLAPALDDAKSELGAIFEKHWAEAISGKG